MNTISWNWMVAIPYVVILAMLMSIATVIGFVMPSRCINYTSGATFHATIVEEYIVACHPGTWMCGNCHFGHVIEEQ